MVREWSITKEIYFYINRAENETGSIVPDLFLFFKKVFYEIKAEGLQLSVNTFP